MKKLFTILFVLAFTLPATAQQMIIEKNGSVDAYNTFVIRREKVFSNETYNQEYNKLSQLVASCSNLEELQKNILSTPYRLLPAQPLNVNSANIANKPGTRELLRWVLNSGSTGEISDIHEYVLDNKKYMMVAAISEIIPEGYRELDDMLRLSSTRRRATSSLPS